MKQHKGMVLLSTLLMITMMATLVLTLMQSTLVLTKMIATIQARKMRFLAMDKAMRLLIKQDFNKEIHRCIQGEQWVESQCQIKAGGSQFYYQVKFLGSFPALCLQRNNIREASFHWQVSVFDEWVQKDRYQLVIRMARHAPQETLPCLKSAQLIHEGQLTWNRVHLSE